MRINYILILILFSFNILGVNQVRCEKLSKSLYDLQNQQNAIFDQDIDKSPSFVELNTEADRLKAELIILETLLKAKNEYLNRKKEFHHKAQKLQFNKDFLSLMKEPASEYDKASLSYTEMVENIIQNHSGVETKVSENLLGTQAARENFDNLIKSYMSVEKPHNKDRLLNDALRVFMGSLPSESIEQRKKRAMILAFQKRDFTQEEIESTTNEKIKEALSERLIEFAATQQETLIQQQKIKEEKKIKSDKIKKIIKQTALNLSRYCAHGSDDNIAESMKEDLLAGKEIDCHYHAYLNKDGHTEFKADSNENANSMTLLAQRFERKTVSGSPLKKILNEAINERCQGATSSHCSKSIEQFGDIFKHNLTKAYEPRPTASNESEDDHEKQRLTNLAKKYHRELIDKLGQSIGKNGYNFTQRDVFGREDTMKEKLFDQVKNNIKRSGLLVQECNLDFNSYSEKADDTSIKTCLDNVRDDVVQEKVSELKAKLKDTQTQITNRINKAKSKKSFKELETLKFITMKHFQSIGCEKSAKVNDPYERSSCDNSDYSNVKNISELFETVEKAKNSTIINSYLNNLGFKDSKSFANDKGHWKSTYDSHCKSYESQSMEYRNVRDETFSCTSNEGQSVANCLPCELIRIKKEEMVTETPEDYERQRSSKSISRQYDPDSGEMVLVRDASSHVAPHAMKYFFSRLGNFVKPSIDILNLKRNLAYGYPSLVAAQTSAHYMYNLRKDYYDSLSDSLTNQYFYNGFYGYPMNYTPTGVEL